MTKASHLRTIAFDAYRYGIQKSLRDGTSQAVYWYVKCECGEKVSVAGGSHSSPELMVKNMRQKGWDLREGKPSKCPECSHPRKDTHMTKPVATSETVTASPIVAAGKIMRVVYNLLEDYFDTGTLLYKGGWTDARIAKEAGTAENVVTKIREESYGKLAEDPEITKLKDDLELLALEVGETFRKFNERIDAFRSRADRLQAGRKV